MVIFRNIFKRGDCKNKYQSDMLSNSQTKWSNLLRSVKYISVYQTEAKLIACDTPLCELGFLNLDFFEKQMKNAVSAFIVLSHWIEREKDKPPTEQSHFFLLGDSQFFEDWQA